MDRSLSPTTGAAGEPGSAAPVVGTLWTWTVQRFAPKSPPYQPPPGGFQPFAVGYVTVPDGTKVLAVLDVPHPRIGMPIRLTRRDGEVPRGRADD